MATVINSNNVLTAWRDACNYILSNGNGHNLMLVIDTPLNYTQQDLGHLLQTGLFTMIGISDISNTIFPRKLYSRSRHLSLSQFYDLHEQLYIRGKTMHSKNRAKWGNYFLRFTKFGHLRINQLQDIIDSINSRSMNYAACYIMHISSAETDSNTRNMGGPCLQYIQFAQEGDKINLTAVYRNHDFLSKALGNYIGLANLLMFVCDQTGKNIGTFTCHSIHFFLDRKTAVRGAINTLPW